MIVGSWGFKPWRKFVALCIDQATKRAFEDLWSSWVDGFLRPKVYIDDKPDSLVAYFEMPGVSKEDIELYVNERSIRVIAKIREEYRVTGRPYEYRKQVVLPTQVDPERVTSKYENGILTVNLPKKVGARRIPVE